MKKLFPIVVISAALTFVACGDDSSSGPEEESSSSIEAEDESSSSVEEGKSSAADKKSSSSEAKKDDSSSSGVPESSSSEPESSSSSIPYGLTCSAKRDGNVVSAEASIKTLDGTVEITQVEYDYDNMKVWQSLPFSMMGIVSCEAIEDDEGVLECSDETKIAEIEYDLEPDDLYPEIATPADAEKNLCSEFESSFDVNAEFLNKEMLDGGKYEEFRDLRDAKLYRTIKVGGQTWMAQNLNYATSSGSSCYGGESYYCYRYGLLYTWETAQTACPDGWRLPTATEWDELLTKTMGAESGSDGHTAYTGEGISLLGGEGRANEYGLSFVFGGVYGSPEAEVPSYNSIGEIGVYWLADEEGNASGVAVLPGESANMFADLGEANMQLYVRCVKSAK